jgi:hypothetical protein
MRNPSQAPIDRKQTLQWFFAYVQNANLSGDNCFVVPI